MAVPLPDEGMRTRTRIPRGIWYSRQSLSGYAVNGPDGISGLSPVRVDGTYGIFEVHTDQGRYSFTREFLLREGTPIWYGNMPFWLTTILNLPAEEESGVEYEALPTPLETYAGTDTGTDVTTWNVTRVVSSEEITLSKFKEGFAWLA